LSFVARLQNASLLREGRRVVDGVSFSVAAGERVALMGPNGAGKTTVLRLLAGLEAPGSGSATRAEGAVGYVPQSAAEAVFPWFTLQRNVAMPRLVQQLADANERAARLLARLLPGIDPLRRASGLSGGERQAVAIARALATPGQLVLADEPFSALSAPMHARALEVLAGELEGRALVLVTHDEADARALGARIVRLDSGAVERAA
jgi:ABC-type nitrate/sulfonate/bicarbonate transport system ATPase subunit